jgi:hypothetical protein
MKTYPDRQPSRARHLRIPAFIPVPQRARADGWTPQRQAAFLVALMRSGSVTAAAREVGMSRESVYRLRRHPQGGSFAATWDAICNRLPIRKLTHAERYRAAMEGRIKPVVWRGECTGITRKVDNSALLGVLGRMPLLPRDGAP